MSWSSGVRLVKAVPRPWPDWVRIAAELVWSPSPSQRARCPRVAAFRPELMTEPLEKRTGGSFRDEHLSIC